MFGPQRQPQEKKPSAPWRTHELGWVSSGAILPAMSMSEARVCSDPSARRQSDWRAAALRAHDDAERLEQLRGDVEAFCSGFPVPGI